MGDIRTEGSSAISEIDISRIEPNPHQPRRSFDETTLEELAASIRELGVVQPLTLRMNDEGNYRDNCRRAALASGTQGRSDLCAGICADSL